MSDFYFRKNILDKLSLVKLDKLLIQRNKVYAFNKASESFSDNIKTGVEYFIQLVENTLYEYEGYKSFTKRTVVKPSSNNISLLENVDDYINGKITEEEVKYHFLSLEAINGSLLSTRSFSIYNHILHNTTAIEEYVYKYRCVLKYNFADDNYLTEDSTIYGINEYEQGFLNHLDLNYLLELQSIGKGIAMIPDNPVELFPNIDNLIQMKRDIVDKNREASTSVSDYWATRGI